MSKLKLVALILLVLSGALIIYGNPWDSTASSHYVPPPEAKSGSSAESLTDLTATDWVYKVTGPDDSTSVQVQNLGDVVYFELDATAPNYVWGNILVLYDKTKLASVSLEENPDNWYGFWTWWTYATGQSTYGGGGNYYYYDYVAGTSIANQGSQWAQDWVNNYGGGGPVGTIEPDYGSILDPNGADYQALANKGITDISNLGAIRLYTSTYAGGMNNNSPLRLGFQVISTGNTAFNVFADDATSYNWHPASLPWHLQSSVALTLAPPPCANMQSDTKTEYGSTVTISGPIEVFTNQPYLINLLAQTDAPIYQWSLYEDGVLKDGQGFVWGNQFDKTLMFAQPTVGDYTYTFNYRGIMGAHGWPPYTPVSITVTVIPALPQIENLTAQIDQYYQAGQIKNPGIYNSLLAKLTGWDNAALQGRLGKLNALTNQLNALNDNSIDPAAREALLKTIAEMTYYQTLLNDIPTTIDLYLSGSPCSSRAIIDIPSASEFDSTVSGILRVQLAPTADPNIASFTIITSSYVGTSITIGGIDFGTLSFMQDPYNASTGTVNLTTGELTMVENLLVSSPFLTQMGFPSVPLQIPQFGTVAIASNSPVGLLVFTGGYGILPAYLPLIGGHNYLLCIAHSTEPPPPGGYKSDPEGTDSTPQPLPKHPVLNCFGVEWLVPVVITILDESGNPVGSEFDCMTVQESISKDGGQTWKDWTGLAPGAEESHVLNGQVTDMVRVQFWTLSEEAANGIASCDIDLPPNWPYSETVQQKLRIKLHDGTYKELPGINTRTKTLTADKTFTVTNSH